MKGTLDITPACLSIITPFILAFGVYIYIFRANLKKLKKQSMESKIYFLIERLNCSKGDAKKNSGNLSMG